MNKELEQNTHNDEMSRKETFGKLSDIKPVNIDQHLYAMTFFGLKDSLAGFYRFLRSMEQICGNEFADLVQSEAWKQVRGEGTKWAQKYKMSSKDNN